MKRLLKNTIQTLISVLTTNSAHSHSLNEKGLSVNNKTPAFALLVIKDGKTVFKAVEGCARFDDNKKCVLKATLNTPFSICSMTKHFTAAAILMLEEQGKLSTEDEITKYLDLPETFRAIKIKHLIHHISGIPDYFSIIDMENLIKEKKKMSIDALIEIIKTLELKPYGVNFAYSNSGYILLSKIIELVSGKSYEAFSTENIFDKLDMKDTFVSSSIDLRKGYTHQYSPWPLFKKENWPMAMEETGDGGIWTSINDYEKWVYAFENNQIFQKKETMEKFLSRGKLDNGTDIPDERGQKETNYGYGINHKDFKYQGKALKTISHSGGMPGTASSFVKFLDQKIWVIYFNNNAAYPDEIDLLNQIGIPLT